jgi:NADPH:quinone reductase-like Zn-dependent oxidoreductase
VGDEVYGLIDGYRDGWAAECVIIEARRLAPKPTPVDFIEAAAIPQAGLTSWQALFDHGHLESGQTVVIHGAGGGVGSVGVQLARWAGAHVTGTGRAGARQRVLELGADKEMLELVEGSRAEPPVVEMWTATGSYRLL